MARPSDPPIPPAAWMAPPTESLAAVITWAGAPSAASLSAMVGRYDVANTEPMMATPRAPPNWRGVSFMAEPTPALDSGSEPMIDSVAGAITSPIPPASTTIDASRCGYPLVTGTPARKISPADTINRPVPTTALVPTRSTTRGDMGATTSMTSDIGNIRMPAWRAEKPSTVCKYWVMRNIEPNMAKNVMVMAALAAEKRRFWKNRTSSMGWLLFNSQMMNAPITTKPITKAVTTLLSPQPLAGASMMAQSSETSPTIERQAPTRSRCGASGSRDVGNRKRPAMRAPMVTGTLIRNTEPHQKWASSSPPSTGPMA